MDAGGAVNEMRASTRQPQSPRSRDAACRSERDGVRRGWSVVVIGCGGNIGSFLVSHLGRIPGLELATLIDRDRYEEKNLVSQDITRRDVGQPKALVQARRLRAINPAVRVRAIVDAVENVPTGLLRADVVLTGLDSRRSRQWVNEGVWRLGQGWIDAGVEGEDLQARIAIYQPGPDAPCLECAWSTRSYELLAQTYPCNGRPSDPPPTNAPSALGALTAARQILECRKLVVGPVEQAATGHELFMDAAYHKQFLTRLRRNPACRFDHEVWRPEGTVRSGLPLSRAAELGVFEGGPWPRLRVHGRLFALGARCGCGTPPLRLAGALDTRCDRCGRLLAPAGTDLRAELDVESLPGPLRRLSLRDVGARRGDLLSLVAPAGSRHFELL
jgi:hypothetical protein